MADTSAGAIKLPTFWTNQPEVWFFQAEAQFHLKKITDNTTKFYHVVAALDMEISKKIYDILSSPPSQNKYQALKTTPRIWDYEARQGL